ncbi:hypothetical protein HDU67_004299 [Dinochytrium kinnereticum]|nr:hypothetical protein HDU67_004299 [Dinochytrium kinnereticum]
MPSIITTTILIGGLLAAAALLLQRATIARAKRVSDGLVLLKNKVVLITGASKGIGEQLAYTYAKQNAIVIIAARTLSRLEEVAEKCKSLGSPRAHVVRFDAKDEASCVALIAKAAELENGQIDVVVLNHAMSVYKPLFEMEVKERMEAVKDMIQANYVGYVAIALAALPYLEKSTPATTGPTSSLVIVSSLAGKFPTPCVHAYSASKHAIDGFFNALRFELNAKWKAEDDAAKFAGAIPSRRRVVVTLCLLGAIKTENFIETVPKDVQAMAVSPEGTAVAIVENAAAEVEQFYHPFYIQMMPILNSVSHSLGQLVVRAAKL